MVHKNKETKSGVTAVDFVNHYAHLSQLTGDQCNDVHPLAYAAGSKGTNPSMLSHDQDIKTINKDKFELYMADELDNIFENDIYEIIKKSNMK